MDEQGRQVADPVFGSADVFEDVFKDSKRGMPIPPSGAAVSGTPDNPLPPPAPPTNN